MPPNTVPKAAEKLPDVRPGDSTVQPGDGLAPANATHDPHDPRLIAACRLLIEWMMTTPEFKQALAESLSQDGDDAG